MNKSTPIAALALVGALSLAGCSVAAERSEPKPAPAQSSEVAPPPAPSPVQEYAAFGDAFTYSDGIELTVSEPREFAPTEYAAGADNPFNIVFDVTLINNSSESFETMASTEVTSGGRAGSRIFDSGNPDLPDNGLSGVGTTVLPGQSITWAEGWSVLDPADLTLVVAPSFLHDDAIFTR